ncbi:MraY family glycosyltransferase [Streptomyces sp. NPDC048664]|uniref:MraY family glycosyltransferase n=1 Tax=Streptomyces sp. NPDC048664 TaxID=3154505 RepID=UPI0034152377
MSEALAAAGAGGAALLLGLLLTEPLRRFALRHGITDRPSARKAHSRPTPYLGGIAVAVATLAASTAAAAVAGAFTPVLALLLGGAALMCLLGLVDDLRPLGAGPRLGAEIAAATAVVLAGGHPAVFGNAVDVVLAVVWIVFTMNAFNFLDNMDGAASSLCAVVGLFVCVSALVDGPGVLGVLTASLTGACLGFLFHNRHPARIFLGDAGSLFLGFTLASAMTVLHDGRPGLTGPVSLLLATLVPTLDTALVMFSRHRESRPLLQGGTDHIAHRLRRMGMPVRQVVRTLSAVAVAGCLASALVTHRLLAPGAALAVICLTGVTAVRLLLKLPTGTAPSPGVVVPTGSVPGAASPLTLRLRPRGGPVRRGGQLRPTAVPHSRAARRTPAPAPPAVP